jgi:hypothetical protein
MELQVSERRHGARLNEADFAERYTTTESVAAPSRG